MPPRDGLHDHRLAARRDPGRDPVLRAARRDARDLARAGHQRAARSRPGLSLFGTVEFCLWDAQDDATNFQRNYSIGEVEVEDGVIYHTTEYRERRDHFAFFACSERSAGFDTSRDAFLGPYRGWDRPIAVERGATSGSIAHGWQPIGAHQARLELAPGETREVIFVLGYAENPKDAKFDPPGSGTIDKRRVRPIIARYLEPAIVDAAFTTLRRDWDDLLGSFQVETGNEHLDRMVNIWNAYQCMVTFNLSRSASLFESGIGRGMGFRDSNQDLLGFVHMVPGAGARADPRHRRDPAAVRRRLPPVPAADEARQRRRRVGLQRRPGLARARGRRLPQGDRRPRHPRRAGPVRQPARAASGPSPTTSGAPSTTRSSASARTGCR